MCCKLSYPNIRPSVCSDTCSSRSRVHNYIQVRTGEVCINWENTWLSVAESVTEFIDVDLDHDLDQSWQSVDSEVTEMLSGSEENE